MIRRGCFELLNRSSSFLLSNNSFGFATSSALASVFVGRRMASTAAAASSTASTSDNSSKKSADPTALGALNKKELLHQYRRAAKLAEKVKAVNSNPLSDSNKKIGKHPLQRRVTVVMTNGATTTLNLVSDSKYLRLEEDYVSLFESSKLRPLRT